MVRCVLLAASFTSDQLGPSIPTWSDWNHFSFFDISVGNLLATIPFEHLGPWAHNSRVQAKPMVCFCWLSLSHPKTRVSCVRPRFFRHLASSSPLLFRETTTLTNRDFLRLVIDQTWNKDSFTKKTRACFFVLSESSYANIDKVVQFWVCEKSIRNAIPGL